MRGVEHVRTALGRSPSWRELLAIAGVKSHDWIVRTVNDLVRRRWLAFGAGPAGQGAGS